MPFLCCGSDHDNPIDDELMLVAVSLNGVLGTVKNE